jgi:hypothetical protein
MKNVKRETAFGDEQHLHRGNNALKRKTPRVDPT